MSFSQAVKLEILDHIKKSDEEKIRAFFLGYFNTKLKDNFVDFNNLAIADFFLSFVADQEVQKIKENKRIVQINITDKWKSYFKIKPKDKKSQSYYLAGLFCACGAVSDPSSQDYHLEIVLENELLVDQLFSLLSLFHLGARVIKRRNKNVVYIKQGFLIADFLSVIHAEGGMLEFENKRIEKDFYASAARVDNCDIANNYKAMNNGKKEVMTLKKININNLVGDFKLVAELRLLNREASYKELAQKYYQLYNKEISKGRISYILKKLCERKI